MKSFEVTAAKKKLPELHNEKQVSKAVERHKKQTGEVVPNSAEARIDTYLSRLQSVLDEPNEKLRERQLEHIKVILHNEYVTDEKVAVDEHLKVQQRIAQNEGRGVIEITDAARSNPETIAVAREVVEKQRDSLDSWVDYFSSAGTEGYPIWFKYYVLRNIVKLQALVKDEKVDDETGERTVTAKLPKRKNNNTTLRPFPELYPGKLGKVFDIYKQHLDVEESEGSVSEEEPQKLFEEKLQKMFEEKFSTIYARESLDAILAKGPENLEEIRGGWRVFKKGTDNDWEQMMDSLKDKNTDWCIEESKKLASSYVEGGDFHIYYSYDEEGEATVPRVAIRFSGNHITEVRGIVGGQRQEVEPELLPILEEKLQEFGGASEQYLKRTAHMKQMTRVYEKFSQNEELSKEELIFLHEIKEPIEAFGNSQDPRIKEVRESRDWVEDMKVICEATDSVEVVRILIEEYQQDRMVGNHLASFDSLPASLANELLDSVEIDKIVDNLEVFKDIDQKNFLQKALKHNTETLLIRREKFDQISDEQFLEMVFDGGQLDRIPRYMAEKFKEVDALPWGRKLIEKGCVASVMEHLKSFPGLSPQEVFEAIPEDERILRVKQNLSLFAPVINQITLDQGKLVKNMVDDGYALNIIQNARYFDLSKVDLTRAMLQVLEKGNPREVSRLELTDIEIPEIVGKKLLETDDAYLVIRDPNRFGITDHNEMVRELVEGGEFKELKSRFAESYNLGIRGLDVKTLELLMENGLNKLHGNIQCFDSEAQLHIYDYLISQEDNYSSDLRFYFDKFETLDDHRIAQGIKKYKEIAESVEKSLDSKKNLPLEIAEALINSEQSVSYLSYRIAMTIDSFSENDHPKIAELLIENGGGMDVKRSFKNFKGLSVNTLKKLLKIRFGNGNEKKIQGEIAKNIYELEPTLLNRVRMMRWR